MSADKSILNRHRHFLSQFLCLIVLNIFAGLVLSGFFLFHGRLYWDNLNLFSVFRDNLHSLNYFKEIQWWSPNLQNGFPTYYLSMLGNNATTPLYVITCFVVWILGLVGVQIKSYASIFIVYFGFLLPFIFSFGFLLLARQIFTNNRVITYLLLLASFSPGVVFCTSDYAHIDQSVYSLYFAAAYLNFTRKPDKKSFCLLSLAVFVLAVSLNHIFLYWNIIFIPLFVVMCNCFNYRSFTATTKRLFFSIPKSYWLCTAILMLFCSLPNIITYTHGNNLMRSKIGKKFYDYRELQAGNPLEFLSVSTPGIGFEWIGGYFTPETVEGPHLSYGYMGVISLTMIILGLIFGHPKWRKRLFVMIASCGAIFILSGFSPVFSTLLVLPTPLHAVNHYSDCMFRIGAFILYLLAIGLGVDALLGKEKHLRWSPIITFAITSLFSIGLYITVFIGTVHTNFELPRNFFGFFMVIVLLYSVAIGWIAKTKDPIARNKLLIFIVFLTFIDISTAAFWHVRNIGWSNSTAYVDPPVDIIGTNDSRSSMTANIMFKQSEIIDLRERGIDPDIFPVAAVTCSARTSFDVKDFSKIDNDSIPYISIPENYRNDQLFRAFFKDTPTAPTNFSSLISYSQSYNSLSVSLYSDREALFFWRDAYSPFWKATINGASTRIARAFGAFKAISIPAGHSTIEFKFSPGIVPFSLAISYLIILVAAGYCIYIFFIAKIHAGSTSNASTDGGPDIV